MVNQNMLRIHEGKLILFRFLITLDLIKCLKQIKYQRLRLPRAHISELPSDIRTMDVLGIMNGCTALHICITSGHEVSDPDNLVGSVRKFTIHFLKVERRKIVFGKNLREKFSGSKYFRSDPALMKGWILIPSPYLNESVSLHQAR